MIFQTLPLQFWWLLAVLRPRMVLDLVPEHLREIFFAERKSLSRLLLLWGVGLFLLAGYWLPFWQLVLGHWSDAVMGLSLPLFAIGLVLIALSLVTYVWREMRGRRG